jgi:hypothetical protein
MYSRDRPIDPAFLPAELLYYRISVEGSIGSRPTGIEIRFPDDSVNRTKYGGEIEDVLYPNYFHLGVAQFTFGSLPKPREFKDQQGDKRVYLLTVEHDPWENNYYHCELRSYREGVRVVRSGKIPEIVKSEFRQALAEAMTIVRCKTRD